MDKHYAQQCFPILRTYLGYMENIKGHSEKTVDGYFVDLRTFFRFLKQYRGFADEQQPESEIAIDDIDLPMLQSVTLNDLYEYLNYANGIVTTTTRLWPEKPFLYACFSDI